MYRLLFPKVRRILSAALIAVCSIMSATASSPKFFGYLMSSNNYLTNAGIYSFRLNDSGSITVEPECVPEGMFNYDMMFNVRGGVWADGYYYIINSDAKKLLKYSTEDWKKVSETAVSDNSLATDLALQPTSGTVYGCFLKPGSLPYDMHCVFGSINLQSGAMTPISDINGFYPGITSTADGTLYAVDAAAKLYKINPTDGKLTLIGATGVALDDIFRPSPLTCDVATGRLYWTVRTSAGSNFYEIDPASGKATLLAPFPDNEYFLSVILPAAASSAAAPSQIADLAVTFASQTGTVTFTMPTTNVDGSAISGSVPYSIAMTGASAVSGSATPGSRVSKSVTTSTNGPVTVTVTLGSGNHTSVTSVDSYAGPDEPAPVTAITAVRGNGGNVSISWTAPAQGAHGGTIDTSKLTYTIRRMPEGTTISSGKSATTFTETLTASQPRAVAYEITPVISGRQGVPAVSPKIVAGPGFKTPYSGDFTSDSSFDLFTITDADSDGITWQRYVNGDEAYASIGSSATNAKNDWLFTPHVAMKPGKQYTLRFSAMANFMTRPEMMEIRIGTDASPKAMTSVIMAATKLDCPSSGTWVDYEYSFSVSSEADRNIGFHAISEPNMSYIGLRGIRIFENEHAAPGIATDIRVTPAPMGAHSADITFRAPSVCVDGSVLSSLSKVEIMLNGTLSATVNAPTPGSEIKTKLTNTREGLNSLEIYCFNTAGKSMPATADVYTGLDAPGIIKNPAVRRNGTEINVSWEAPDGIHGGYIMPDSVEYILARYIGDDYTMLGPVLGDTSFTDEYEAESQTIITYMIFPTNKLGYGRGAATPPVVVGGTPYPLPWTESFASGFCTTICGIASVNGLGTWNLWSADNFSISPADNDRGAIVYNPDKAGDIGRIFFGNMCFNGTTDPTIEFYYYNDPTSPNSIMVEVNGDKGQWERACTVTMNPTAKAGWTKASASLAQFRDDRLVNVSLVAEAQEKTPVLVDRLTVRDVVMTDLGAELDCQRRFTVGSPNDLTATVTNLGRTPISKYRVDFYCGNRIVATAASPAPLAPDAQTIITAPVTPSADFPVTGLYTAVVVADGDMLHANDRSAAVKVTHVHPKYPAPSLEGTTSADGDVQLTWTRPDLAQAQIPTPVTDDFESYEPFLIDEVGEWTLIDVDGADGTFGLLGFHFPWREEPKSFQVFGLEALGITMSDDETTWKTHSGSLMLVAFADADRANNDWLISPLLSGQAQTISFYARSAHYMYGLEDYAVMASSKGTSISDFTLVTEGTLSTEWDEIAVDLPAGTRYFAIRCTSSDAFAMCVDDVTYTPATGIPADIAFKGYNLYVDGKKVIDCAASITDYSASAVTDGTEFAVTATYNCGESAPATYWSDSAAAAITGATAGSPITVFSRPGAIVIQGADGLPVSVYTADGTLLRTITGAPVTVIPCSQGIRIVRAGAFATKLIVK